MQASTTQPIGTEGRYQWWMAFWFPASMVLVFLGILVFEWESGLNLKQFGTVPRTPQGLLGILTMPLLHSGWEHLLNNSLPLMVLGGAIFYFYRKVAFRVVLFSWVVPGLLVWLVGRPSVHIGASGMVYAFVTFIFFSGIIRNHLKLIALSLTVVFLYGSMVWGIFPIRPAMSWEGHMGGALIGIVLAIAFRNIGGPKEPVYSWQLEEEEEEDEMGEDGVPVVEAGSMIGQVLPSQSTGIRIRYHIVPNPNEEKAKEKPHSGEAASENSSESSSD